MRYAGRRRETRHVRVELVVRQIGYGLAAQKLAGVSIHARDHSPDWWEWLGGGFVRGSATSDEVTNQFSEREALLFHSEGRPRKTGIINVAAETARVANPAD
ncbi:hypothetical protein CKY28_10465 [Sphingomonas lenta]|uniref:Uncharacterized protein n=2 Tax=Sphingomonas lenta TaxID=1141887 RepID=A0A2A2SFN1_9SPHN|nr:hypothetical protein CKY28_10465 [Sphingomonas lenta]